MNEKQVTPKGVIDTLMQFTSREDAMKFMVNSNFTNAFLKEIGKEGCICFYGRTSKKAMIERIVEGMVGSKLKFDTLLHCDLHGGGCEPVAQVAQESREVRNDDTKTNAEETNLTPEQAQWLATASGDELLDSLLNMQFHNRFGCNNEAIANVRREILRRMGEIK